MDVGRTLETGALRGKSVMTRLCDALSKTTAFLAAVLSFISTRSGRMAKWLERSSLVLESKATGVPLGVDVAGEEWEEPAFLPDAPEPPPIPPSAFFTVKPPEQDEEWAAALAVAKLDAKGDAAPAVAKVDAKPDAEPSEQEWEAALVAAKKAATPAPVIAKPAPVKAAETPKPVVAKAAPAPKITELRVGPKSATHRAVEPHIALKPVATPARDTTPRAVVSPAEVQTAAATRKAVAAALRS